jgi:hypothetical protein
MARNWDSLTLFGKTYTFNRGKYNFFGKNSPLLKKMNLDILKCNIIDSDIIVIDDYYFVDFRFIDRGGEIILRLSSGYNVIGGKRKSFIFDAESLKQAFMKDNTVLVYDSKGHLCKLELMELVAKKID